LKAGARLNHKNDKESRQQKTGAIARAGFGLRSAARVAHR